MKKDLYDIIVTHIVENQEKFYRLAFSYVKNKDDALDHYESLRNEEAVKTWFYRILVNESVHFLNRRKREVLSGEDYDEQIPYYEKRYEAEGDLEAQIDRLEEDVQKIIRLRFYEELSLKEISQIMELNLNTVKAKLYRGLKLLKQIVQEVE